MDAGTGGATPVLNLRIVTGAQIKAVRSMLNQLSKGHTAAEPPPDDRAPELNAIDATHDSVSLVWNRGAHASGYHLDRSSEGAIGFQRVTDRLEQGVSYVDRGLSPDTTYRYRLQYISDTGELLESNTAITTRSLPASCDPYFNDNVTHVSGKAGPGFGSDSLCQGILGLHGLMEPVH